MTKKQTTIITSLSIAAIILALLVSARFWFRIDLTAGKSYTISPVSRSLARDLPEPVQITYFISDKLRQLYPNPGEVEDFLREYTTYSRGKIRVTSRDPAKAGLEEQMQNLGIPAQQIQTVERDDMSFALVYTGILIEYLDQNEVIPVVFATDTLEYDLTSRIRSMISGSKRTAGMIIADPNQSAEQNYRNLTGYLHQAGYDVQQISPGEDIPANLNQLFVLGGADSLDDWALYRIDNYIQNGGKVFFMANSINININQYGVFAMPYEDAGLLAMLESYGAKIDPALVLDTASIRFPAQTATGVVQMISYPFWVSVQQENSNSENPVTAHFSGVDLFWPSPIELNAPAGATAEALFDSTPEAWLQTKDFVLDPGKAIMFSAEIDATKGQKILCAAISGKIPSFFRGKAKPEREGSDELLPDLPTEGADGLVVVIGNSNFVNDQFLRDARNLSFVVGVADWLGNDDDIISIRNRAPASRHLDRIIDPMERLSAMGLARIINVALIPLLVLIVAIVLAHKRKKRTQIGKTEASDAV